MSTTLLRDVDHDLARGGAVLDGPDAADLYPAH
jgi:hypothetical protein